MARVRVGARTYRFPNPFRRFYEWVLHWAETPYGIPVLIAVAFLESSFLMFPIDLLVIALAVSIPRRSFVYGGIAAGASVVGAAFGYAIGSAFYGEIGEPIIRLYGLEEEFKLLQVKFSDNTFLTVFLAAFTPIPFKVFTIGAGFFKTNVAVFLLASALGRGARFEIEGGLIYFFGPAIKSFIDRYFNWITVLLGVAGVLGFLALKLLS